MKSMQIVIAFVDFILSSFLWFMTVAKEPSHWHCAAVSSQTGSCVGFLLNRRDHCRAALSVMAESFISIT
jgi:hypothetical protein